MYELTTGRNYSYFSISNNTDENKKNISESRVYDYSYGPGSDKTFTYDFNNSCNSNIYNEPSNVDSNGGPNITLQEVVDLTSEYNQVNYWSVDLYQHTTSRVLNKQKFVSPGKLIGDSNGFFGQYNYSYYNTQLPEDPEIIDYTTQPHKSSKNKTSLNNMDTPSHSQNTSHFPILPAQSDKQLIHINSIFKRPYSTKYVIILRGLPGSGKSEFCQAFKNKEIELGHQGPRILSLDPFFVEDGHFDYDPEMESVYYDELFKTFKRQINENYYSIIILDCINRKVSQFSRFYSFADLNLFNVCVLEFKSSLAMCTKRSEKKYKPDVILKMSQEWEEVPDIFSRLDATSFLQETCIEDVEMEDAEEDKAVIVIDSDDENGSEDDDSDLESGNNTFFKSKWDEDFEEIKDRLDGMKTVPHEHESVNIFELIQNELERTEALSDGRNQKKRVKWADFENMKKVQKRKQMGLAITTDWNSLMGSDIELAERALVQIRYYEKC